MSWSVWDTFPNIEDWTLAEVHYDIGHTQIGYPLNKIDTYNFPCFFCRIKQKQISALLDYLKIDHFQPWFLLSVENIKENLVQSHKVIVAEVQNF